VLGIDAHKYYIKLTVLLIFTYIVCLQCCRCGAKYNA